MEFLSQRDNYHGKISENKPAAASSKFRLVEMTLIAIPSRAVLA